MTHWMCVIVNKRSSVQDRAVACSLVSVSLLAIGEREEEHTTPTRAKRTFEDDVGVFL